MLIKNQILLKKNSRVFTSACQQRSGKMQSILFLIFNQDKGSKINEMNCNEN